ncbi:MAG TPA: class II aldolase/adducin family protein [Candidatus Omnitrophota bacterium]|nr:class II aldolase/adducin family protein [Candidatus Omnitrophota bacterium]
MMACGMKKDMIEIGSLLWEKDLASGLNGNISCRVDAQKYLITGRGTCLGRLSGNDLVMTDMEEKVYGKGQPSSEKTLHAAIYQNFPDVKAVIHTHLTYASGYFHVNDKLTPSTFESRLYLGEVTCVEQFTPTVTDVKPVIEALKKNNIMVLKDHGVLAMGKNLFDCFLLIQCLEESVKMDVVSRIYAQDPKSKTQDTVSKENGSAGKRFKLFSQEQIDEIVRLVNADEQLKKLGTATNMTMQLAVKLDETNQAYCFNFEKGVIKDVSSSETAEFVVSASEKVWRAVFAREIDPFVATTQKKMVLKGDFAKISKWYAPCSRLFELWQQAPVE